MIECLKTPRRARGCATELSKCTTLKADALMYCYSYLHWPRWLLATDAVQNLETHQSLDTGASEQTQVNCRGVSSPIPPLAATARVPQLPGQRRRRTLS